MEMSPMHSRTNLFSDRETEAGMRTPPSPSPSLHSRTFAGLNDAFRSRFSSNTEKCCCLFSVAVSILAFIFFVSLIVVATSKSSVVSVPGDENDYCSSSLCYNYSREFYSFMDLSVKPCDDFYAFSCNNWIKKTTMPDSRLEWDRIAHTQDYITDHIRVLLDNGVNPERSDAVEKAIMFFKTCRNSTERQASDLKHLKDLLIQRGISFPLIDPSFKKGTVWSASKTILAMNHMGIPGRLLAIGVKSDEKNTKQKTLVSLSPSITADTHTSLRTGYTKLMKTVMKSVGIDVTDEIVKSIIDFENQLRDAASKSSSEVTVQRYNALHNMGKFVWRILLTDFEHMTTPVTPLAELTISMTAKEFFVNAAQIMEGKDDILANYLGWKTLQHLVQFTSIDMRNEVFEFGNETYQVPAQIALAPQCVDYVTTYLPFAVGRLFHQDVKRVESLAGTMIIMDYVKRAMINRIEKENQWLDPSTKKVVINKIKGIVVDYFFPHDLSPPRAPYSLIDKMYHEIEVPRGPPEKPVVLPLVEWILSLNKFTFFKTIKQLNQGPVTETSLYTWEKSPTSNSATYVTSWNMIVVPVGMMFEPYFIPGRPPAVNFGSLGFVLAHEVSHAFDVTARSMDANGDRVEKEQWTEGSLKEYTERGGCLVSQYNQYQWTEGKNISGVKTLNENIADSEGLRLAFDAFTLYMKHHPLDREQRLPKEMRGFTPEQLFFISFANTWCSKMRNQFLVQAITDIYSPKKYRVIGSTVNSQFGDVFKCPIGTQMNPTQKCRIF